MALEFMAHAEGPIPLDISFRVEPGELLALVGHSGSGKSTILRTIAGLWRPATARVWVSGAVWSDTSKSIRLPPYRRRVGMVFQSYALFPHMTAEDNVMTAMPDLPRTDRRAEAQRLLALIHLTGLERRRPLELSGGQQQRVAVARALARRPEVLLLDEPFSAVDRATRERLHQEIRALREHLSMPVVLVTHDVEEARLLADRMVVIEKGALVAHGTTAEVMFDPVALRALGLREAGAAISARILAHEADGLTCLQTSAGRLWLPHVDGKAGTAVRVQILAHEVMLAREPPAGLSALNVLPGQVVALKSEDGAGVIVQLRVGEETILARITQRSANTLELAPDTPCYAVIKSMSIARDQPWKDR